jgi:N-acetylneuraminic acid mutarotase
MAELTLILLTLFVLIAGTMVPLQGQTDPADDQRPAIARNSWSKGAAMPKALKFVMTGVIGGKVYVVGGVTNTAVVSENLVYNPLTNRWSSEAALPVATCDAASAVVKNVFYVFGGSTDGKTVTNAVWAYNPTTNKWSAKSPMPTARASAGAAVDNNIIFVIGGTDATNRFNTVESYNPVTDSWSKEASLIVGKSDLQLGCSEPRLWPPTDSAPLETPETMKGTTHPPTRGNR